MARLTERYESGGTAMIKGCGDNCKYGCKHCTQGGDIGDCETIDDVIDKLADYEDAEEQGLLLRLPCKVGDKIWWLNGKILMESEVESFAVCEEGLSFIHVRYLHDKEHNRYYGHNLDVDKIGKTVFLTREEAEKALADSRA